MPREFICQHCKQVVRANPRLKGGQRYCHAKACQRARKREWQRDKMAADMAYRLRQKECQKRWRRQKPLHEYQREYREQHPQYVETNRLKQNERNKKRHKEFDMEKIVKMDALVKPSMKTNIYLLNSLGRDTTEKIVKMDTLIVQLTPLHDMSLLHSCFCLDCKDGRH